MASQYYNSNEEAKKPNPSHDPDIPYSLEVRPLATVPQYPVASYPPPYSPEERTEEQSLENRKYLKNQTYPPQASSRRKPKHAILHRCVLTTRWKENPHAEEIAKHIFSNYTTTEKTGPKYRVVVYKESQGETIAVYYYSDSIRVDFITHKLQRLRYYYEYTVQFGGTIRSLQVEVYTRIHRISEKRVEVALEALRRSLGKGKTHIVKSVKFEDRNYLLRVEKFEYQGYQVSVKLYYDKHMKEDPKVEVLVKAVTQTIDNTLHTASTVLHTLIKAANPVVVYNNYDQEQDKVPLNPVDKTLLKRIRGTRPRVKGEVLLEKQLHDKHKVVKELLLRGLKPDEIAKVLGYSDRYVRYIIEDLIQAGEIVRIARGKYTTPKKQEKREERTLARLSDIVNNKVENVITLYTPRGLTREEVINYVKTRYPRALEHPESAKLKAYPPVFYVEEDNAVVYITPIVRAV